MRTPTVEQLQMSGRIMLIPMEQERLTALLGEVGNDPTWLVEIGRVLQPGHLRSINLCRGRPLRYDVTLGRRLATVWLPEDAEPGDYVPAKQLRCNREHGACLYKVVLSLRRIVPGWYSR